MKENMLSTLKSDGKVFFKLVKLATDVGKTKLEIRSKTAKKDLLIKEIGSVVHEMYAQLQCINDDELMQHIGGDLNSVQALLEEIATLQASIAQARENFKSSGAKPDTPPAT